MNANVNICVTYECLAKLNDRLDFVFFNYALSGVTFLSKVIIKTLKKGEIPEKKLYLLIC